MGQGFVLHAWVSAVRRNLKEAEVIEGVLRCERWENESRKKTTSFSSYLIYMGTLICCRNCHPSP